MQLPNHSLVYRNKKGIGYRSEGLCDHSGPTTSVEAVLLSWTIPPSSIAHSSTHLVATPIIDKHTTLIGCCGCRGVGTCPHELEQDRVTNGTTHRASAGQDSQVDEDDNPERKKKGEKRWMRKRERIISAWPSVLTFARGSCCKHSD